MSFFMFWRVPIWDQRIAKDETSLSLENVSKGRPLPKEISMLRDLRELSLEGNDLKSLPNELYSLTTLRNLNLSCNHLPIITDSIAALSRLVILKLNNNHLESLPESLYSLCGLQQLDLSNNRIAALSHGFSSLTNLDSLLLNNNQLTEFPEELLTSLTALRSLNIRGNKLGSISKKIGALSRLERLWLSDNELTSVPKVLFSLPKLARVDLRANHFSELSPKLRIRAGIEIVGVSWKSSGGGNVLGASAAASASASSIRMSGKKAVRQVNIWNTEYPSDLVKLDLTAKAKKQPLPLEIGVFNDLTSLVLNNNQLAALPEELFSLHSLQMLYLTGNRLTSLSESVSALSNLQRLYLDNNRLADLPETLYSLTTLNQLFLSNNRFSALSNRIGALSRLEKLYIDNNRLTALPESLYSIGSLTLINLTRNQLKAIPRSVQSLTRLESLVLIRNELHSLPNELLSMPSLKELHIGHNFIQSLPSNVRMSSSLKIYGIDLNAAQQQLSIHTQKPAKAGSSSTPRLSKKMSITEINQRLPDLEKALQSPITTTQKKQKKKPKSEASTAATTPTTPTAATATKTTTATTATTATKTATATATTTAVATESGSSKSSSSSKTASNAKKQKQSGSGSNNNNSSSSSNSSTATNNSTGSGASKKKQKKGKTDKLNTSVEPSNTSSNNSNNSNNNSKQSQPNPQNITTNNSNNSNSNSNNTSNKSNGSGRSISSSSIGGYLVIAPKDLSGDSVFLGSGAFGTVFRCKWLGEDICVKKLRTALDDEDRLAFIREVEIMAAIQHPRCLRLFGANLEPQSPDEAMFLVSEFMAGGSLHDLLYKTREKLSATQMKRLACDILAGLVYLHSREPPIIHRDLKSQNVLLDAPTGDSRAKVADFGYARSSINSSMTQNIGTPIFMAPELMKGGHYDAKADMWSFGMILYEMLTNKAPYSHMRITPFSILMELERGTRPVMDSTDLQRLKAEPSLVRFRELMESCWDADPNRRPTAREAFSVIESIST